MHCSSSSMLNLSAMCTLRSRKDDSCVPLPGNNAYTKTSFQNIVFGSCMLAQIAIVARESLLDVTSSKLGGDFSSGVQMLKRSWSWSWPFTIPMKVSLHFQGMTQVSTSLEGKGWCPRWHVGSRKDPQVSFTSCGILRKDLKSA